MANTKADSLNKEASNPKNKPAKILQLLNIKPGEYIGDIGAGGGYFTMKFAHAVGKKGHVYAVDMNQDLLKYIKENARTDGLNNIKTIHLIEETLTLPQRVDLLFCRNTCHHIKNRGIYLKKLKQFLKPNGRIVIIEYKKPKFFTFLKNLCNYVTRDAIRHYISRETILKEMKFFGYILLKDFDFLPEQHFFIFSA